MRRNRIPGRESRGLTALVSVSALVVYVGMWLGPFGVDVEAVDGLRGYGLDHPAWVTFWDVVCTVFGPNGFRVVGLLAIVWVALRRNYRVVLFLLVSIGVSGVVTEVAKSLADRPRPVDALVYAPSSAFPSGHAVAAMVGVLALLCVMGDLLGRATRLAALIGVIVVLAVGFGRVALAVHYPSDVLAGWALGYLWFLVCHKVFRPLPLGGGRNTASAR